VEAIDGRGRRRTPFWEQMVAGSIPAAPTTTTAATDGLPSFPKGLTTDAPSPHDTCADTWNAQGNNCGAFERCSCHRFRTVAVRRSVGFSPVVFGSRGVGSERSQNDRWPIAPQTIVGSAMRPLEDHLPARVVARLLGIKPKTLAAWRAKGKGPSGFFHV